MTFQELINMTRQELIGVWIEASDSGDTELEELAVLAMVATQTTNNMSRKGPQLTPQNIDETNAQRSERLNMTRRHF
mgnify:FL=1|tara:strand:- start:429 stop:659 length:231 start_codon:yes stop_codon:yes gene_type:complete